MTNQRQGSIHLFRFAGVDLFLHWSWFLVAAFEIADRAKSYSSLTWNVLEYLALFLIVMMHEYGHALVCRLVGGKANQIVLWPLGGIAYVDPPPRPGPTLWSIAAGPLVNVALLIMLGQLRVLDRSLGWALTAPDIHAFMRTLWYVNLVLLTFNLLPIYPLDGGQILRSLLWFPLGRARSLMAAVIIGFVGVAGLLLLAARLQSIWIAAIAVFVLMSCWKGWQQARALRLWAKLPRREGFACPSCKVSPPVGSFWKCGRCGQAFDTFQTQAQCPSCAERAAVTTCPDCRAKNPMSEWVIPAAVGVGS